MFLSIDVGNTQTAIGFYLIAERHYGARLENAYRSTTPPILHGEISSTFFQKDGLSLDDVEAGGLSCVISCYPHVLDSAALSCNGASLSPH